MKVDENEMSITKEQYQVIKDEINKLCSELKVKCDEFAIDDFLRTKRRVHKYRLIDDYGKSFEYTDKVRPGEVLATPLNFENCGYGDNKITTIAEWIHYAISSRRFSLENVGKNVEETKNSFLESHRKSGPIKIDEDCRYYNGEDGNHRLLNLVLSQFLEKLSNENNMEITDKYIMKLKAKFMHSVSLINQMDKKVEEVSILNKESPYSLSAREFRKFSYGSNVDEANYCADFTYEGRKYKYDFNGLTYAGGEEELTEFLKTHASNPDIMQWSVGGYYYVAYGSKVYKTLNKDKVAEIIEHVSTMEKEDNAFAEVKCVETDKYEIFVPAITIKATDARCVDIARYFKNLCINSQFDYLFTKCNLKKDDILGFCDAAIEFGNNLYIAERSYTHLTKAEHTLLRGLIATEFEKINEIEPLGV